MRKMHESQNHLVKIPSRSAFLKIRTPLETGLLVAVVLLVLVLVICVILVIVLGIENRDLRKENEANIKVCKSEECIRSANSLIEAMDRSVDPCEDFYTYACGNFGNRHPVKIGESENSWFTDATENLQREQIELLSKEVNTSSDPNAVIIAKNLYKACLDTAKIEELELEPLMQVFENVSLPKQIPNNETAANWDIATTLALIKKIIGFDVLVKTSISFDAQPDTVILSLEPYAGTPAKLLGLTSVIKTPSTVRRASLVPESEELKLRVGFISEVLQKIDEWLKKKGIDPGKTSYEAAAMKILLFASQTAINATDEEIQTKISVLQDSMDMTKKGAKFNHEINWKKYMKILKQDINSSFDIEESIVSITDLIYFQKLSWVLSNSQMETIQRYVWWQVVDVLAPFMSSDLRNLRTKLEEKIYDIAEDPKRSIVCFQQIKKLMPHTPNYLMATRSDFTPIARRVRSMLNDIRAAFKSLVTENVWMDSKTKKAAEEKADAILFFIGYQDWLFEPGKLDEHYFVKNIKVQDGSYLWGILQVKSRGVEEIFTIVNKPFVRYRNNSWNTYDVLQVDAFYSPEENIIAILGGILQFPFYGKGLESLNYGAIGAVLGHEFTHGFDSNGKDYTKDGKKETWWNQKMLDSFNERAKCFVKQYGNFSYGSKEVNGEHTLAENIADNGGVREAYKAYQNHVKLHGPELGLPGLEEFSSEQLLFLSFANIWCETEGPGFEIDISDEHSPQRFRVLGTLANSPEFSSTWKCHANSKMNSSPNRCIIW